MTYVLRLSWLCFQNCFISLFNFVCWYGVNVCIYQHIYTWIQATGWTVKYFLSNMLYVFEQFATTSAVPYRLAKFRSWLMGGSIVNVAAETVLCKYPKNKDCTGLIVVMVHACHISTVINLDRASRCETNKCHSVQILLVFKLSILTRSVIIASLYAARIMFLRIFMPICKSLFSSVMLTWRYCWAFYPCINEVTKYCLMMN